MKNHARPALAIALSLLISISAIAQQPKKRTPSMSTDDVVKSSPAATSSGEWSRYSPGNSTFSLELPGQPQPLDLPLPSQMQKELQSATGYLYTDGRLVVVIAHLVPKQGSTAAAELKNFASQLSRGARGDGASVKVIDQSTVMISHQLNEGGGSQQLEGLAKLVRGTVWMVMAIYPQGDESGHALAQRVIDSAIFE